MGCLGRYVPPSSLDLRVWSSGEEMCKVDTPLARPTLAASFYSFKAKIDEPPLPSFFATSQVNPTRTLARKMLRNSSSRTRSSTSGAKCPTRPR